MRHSRLQVLAASLCVVAFSMSLAGCTVASATHAATSSAQLSCAGLVSGSTPYGGVSGVSGLQLPAGAYISKAAMAGGDVGQYTVATYKACFSGSESQIDGPSSSTISKLVVAGWKLNNLFPDPVNYAFLDACSSSHHCLNDSGSPNPFTFVGFDHYASHPGGYTTFQLQVATIGAPSCLNDPAYYSGTPKYTLYFDGNSANASGNPKYHIQMPPGTRVSNFNGGDSAGSTFVYFCGSGDAGSILTFLTESMSAAGWITVSNFPDDFTARYGANPVYQIEVVVDHSSNYYLRVFTASLSSTGR